jgi:hypothetical protein
VNSFVNGLIVSFVTGVLFLGCVVEDARMNKRTGCCKSPIQFEKRVCLPKPALNLLKTCRNELKTWFLLDLLVYEGLDKRCKPGLKRPKTYQKPTLNQV